MNNQFFTTGELYSSVTQELGVIPPELCNYIDQMLEIFVDDDVLQRFMVTFAAVGANGNSIRLERFMGMGSVTGVVRIYIRKKLTCH